MKKNIFTDYIMPVVLVSLFLGMCVLGVWGMADYIGHVFHR